MKVGFVHTTPPSIGMVERFVESCLPDVEYVHLYDGNVKIDNFKSPAGVTPKSNLLRYAVFADQLERAGCRVIVSCCSLMPRATAYGRQVVSVPFIQLDSVILDRAVAEFRKIGVINTTPYVVPYIEEGLTQRAAVLGKEIEYSFSSNNTALDLFNRGEFEEHDRIVMEDIRSLAATGVDCILMGQIPFAVMDDDLKRLDLDIPILYAGSEAFLHVKGLVEGDAV
jgi:aspartate/glutamate racemase